MKWRNSKREQSGRWMCTVHILSVNSQHRVENIQARSVCKSARSSATTQHKSRWNKRRIRQTARPFYFSSYFFLFFLYFFFEICIYTYLYREIQRGAFIIPGAINKDACERHPDMSARKTSARFYFFFYSVFFLREHK